MDQIHAALCGAYEDVRWFAFGDAVRLAQQIYNVCIAYPKNKDDKEVRRQLLEVAERTQSFLSSNNGSPTREESYKGLSEAIINERIES